MSGKALVLEINLSLYCNLFVYFLVCWNSKVKREG